MAVDPVTVIITIAMTATATTAIQKKKPEGMINRIKKK